MSKVEFALFSPQAGQPVKALFDRAALCEKLGARVVEPEALVTPQWPHDIVDEPFDVALECSGNGRAQATRPVGKDAREGGDGHMPPLRADTAP